MTLGRAVQRLWLILAVVLVLWIAAPVVAVSANVALFQTEQEAQQHCPTDTVVWVNTKSGVYHFRGQRWYGATANGAFVCRNEADQAGYRATRNGQ